MRTGLVLIAAAWAGISLACTGFVLGIDNNAYHLPIVGALFDEPQFSSDAFIQSLHYFASGIWLLLRGAGRVVDAWWLFLALDYLSRLAAFIGFLLCASCLGVRSTRDRVIFGAVICFMSVLRGEAAAGDGGLFLDYFTHSEVANGTILIALYFAMRARWTPALVMVGLTFFINIFMAVWLCLPLAALLGWQLRSGAMHLARASRQLAAGGILALILAAPVLVNLVSNPEFGVPPGIDVVEAHAFEYPYHFLPQFTPLREFVALAVVALLGVVALLELGKCSRPLRVVYAGMLATYLIGVILPFVHTSPLLLNLSLLRSGVLLYLVSSLAVGSVATLWLSSSNPITARISAPLLIVALCTKKVVLPLAFACFLLKWLSGRRPSPQRVPRFDLLTAGVLLLGVWPISFARNWEEQSRERAFVAEMRGGSGASDRIPGSISG